MRNFLLVVGALLAGLVVGSWGPRGEVLRLRTRLDELSEKQARCARGSAAAGIRELLKAQAPEAEAPDKQRARERTNRPATPPPPPPATPGEPSPVAAPVAEIGEGADAAMVALDARAAQARAALAEQGDLSDEQVAAVDEVLADMNTRLKQEVDAFVADALAQGDVDRRDVMDFAAESLDAMIAADDGLRAAVGAEAYAGLDPEAADPFSFITGDTIASLSKLQDMQLPEVE